MFFANYLTVLISTYKTNYKTLEDCIKSINQQSKIMVIENSNDDEFKIKVERQLPNVEVVLSGSNLGYGGALNYGIKRAKTRYVLLSNPDVIYEKNFFEEINNYISKKIEFNIIGVNYINNPDFSTYHTFPEKFFWKNKKTSNTIIKNEKDDSLIEVDWVMGCSMLLDLSKFASKEFFDENYFFYFEEIDLCKNTKIKNGKIYASNNLLINHEGNRGSLATDPSYSIETEIFRNWHFYWSYFYYCKKHVSYINAVYRMFGKFFKFFFKMIFFTLIFNKKNQMIYYGRCSGIFNSMIGKKSWYRVKSLIE
jgi:GT2 family glycosyltransferase